MRGLRNGLFSIYAAMLVILVLAGWGMESRIGAFAKKGIAQDGEADAKLLALNFNSTAAKFQDAARAMANSHEIVSASGEPTPGNIKAASDMLDTYVRLFGGTACYLMDATGTIKPERSWQFCRQEFRIQALFQAIY